MSVLTTGQAVTVDSVTAGSGIIDSLEPGRIRVDVTKAMYILEPDETPFLQIVSGIANKLPTKSQDFWHWELNDADFQKIQIDAVSAAGLEDTTGQRNQTGTVTVPVNDAANIAVSDLIYVPMTREQMLVTGVNYGTGVVNVTRGYGHASKHNAEAITSLTAIVAGANSIDALIGGTAIEDNSDTPDSKYIAPFKVDNTTQNFRDNYSLSDSVMASEADAENVYTDNQHQALRRHKRRMELAGIFGQYNVEFVNGKRRGTTRGFISYIENKDSYTTLPSTVFDWNGLEVNELLMERAMARLFRYGSKDKIAIGGRNFASQLSLLTVKTVSGNTPSATNAPATYSTSGKVQHQLPIKEYGLNLERYVSFHGRLKIASTDILESRTVTMATGSSGQFGNAGRLCLVIDPKNVFWRPLAANGRSRDTHMVVRQAPNGRDGIIEGYITEAGLKVVAPPTHGLIVNVPDV